MHKNLKRFGHEGIIRDDADFPRLRTQFEAMVVRDMRERGFVPVLGLGPFWSTRYNSEKEWYDFIITAHGFYVGKENSCELEGITVDGNLMRRPTPPSKSSMFSENAE